MSKQNAKFQPRRSIIGWFFLLLLIIGLFLSLAWPVPWLEIDHGTVTKAVYPGFDGMRFALRWKHSVELEDWIEDYRIVDSHVDIAATRFKTFGAGVPAHAGKHTKLVGDWVVMSGIDRSVAPLTVQAASAENYRFRYEGGGWQRLSHNGNAPILVFHVVRASIIAMLPRLVATAWHGVGS